MLREAAATHRLVRRGGFSARGTRAGWQAHSRGANVLRVIPFTYLRASSVDDALARLAAPGHAAIGGGTDLLVTIEEGLAAPSAVIDVRALAESLGVTR